MHINPVKVAVMYDAVGCEFMEFVIKSDSDIEGIISDYNSDGAYCLHFKEIKTDYEYTA